MVTFEDIIHDKELLRAINDLGFAAPTPIQEATVPLGLEGHDVIGQAKTGSGKTFAFGIPILHSLARDLHAQALIVAPTRELCQQITRELRKLAKYVKPNIVTIYGGVGIEKQIKELRKAQIIVGTPGRLLDHLRRNTLQPKHIKTLVLDEGDRMFDMGFIEDIETIIDALPEQRQILLFSATIPPTIKKLIEAHLYNPEHVQTSSHVEEEYLPQIYYVVEHNRKFSLLYHLINEEEFDKSIIFCGTRRTVEAVAKNLQNQKVRAESLHGGLSQSKRNKIMDMFRHGKIHLLIATDVAARGLDINDVTHVINYDVPQNPEDYIHRIGRTARAGKSGKAITLLEQRDFQAFQGVLDIVPAEPEEREAPDVRNVGFRTQQRERRVGQQQSGPRKYGRKTNKRRGPPRRR